MADLTRDAIRAYELSVLHWLTGSRNSDVLVDYATAALVQGVDSPSLARVAGMPKRMGAGHEIEELTQDALAELGCESPVSQQRARVRIAAEAARKIVEGGSPKLLDDFLFFAEWDEVTPELARARELRFRWWNAEPRGEDPEVLATKIRDEMRHWLQAHAA